MLEDKVPDTESSLTVRRRPIELVLTEEGLTPLALVLPPLEDLMEMKALQTARFSLHELAETTRSVLC